MASFKASSSSSGRFVSVTAVLILLAVIINIYPAPAAASLEAVDEVAKDQGTTEVASVHHHEIQRRVVLQDGLISSIMAAIKGIPRYRFKRGPHTSEMPDFLKYLDRKACNPTYCYMFGNSCRCITRLIHGYRRCNPNAVSYCCKARYGVCTGCCLGSNGPRNGVTP